MKIKEIVSKKLHYHYYFYSHYPCFWAEKAKIAQVHLVVGRESKFNYLTAPCIPPGLSAGLGGNFWSLGDHFVTLVHSSRIVSLIWNLKSKSLAAPGGVYY